MDFCNNRQYNDLNGEIFKDICGYEGKYQISNYGRIRSLPRYKDMGKFYAFQDGRILKQFKNNQKTEHLKAYLFYDGYRKMYLVHRLVGFAFIENPHNYPDINHKDENPKNNIVNNLEWCTVLYNNNYGTTIERSSKGHWKKVVQLDKEGNLIATWDSIKEAKSQFKGDSHGISDCCKYPEQHKSVKGYMWMYYDDYINNDIKQYKDNKKIPVVQLTKKGEFIKEWDSAISVIKELGYKSNKITECCKKERKSFNGFMWMYLSEYNENKQINPFVNERQRGVVQLTLDGEYITSWESTNKAGKHLNKTNGSAINACCRSKAKYAYGYKWMYKTEYYENVVNS